MIFIKETRIAASPEAVFAFHESPGCLKLLIPPWEKVKLESGGESLHVGSRIVLRTYLGPFPVRWVAEHFEYDPPRGFADRQVSGPFVLWIHHHRFLDDGAGGTILRDEVDYEAPFGTLGRMLGDGFIRRKLSRMFEYRHTKTRVILESLSRSSTGLPP
jgi:ligand-binding SRPBCC domain-containing protein